MVLAGLVRAEFGVWDTNLSGNEVKLEFARPTLSDNLSVKAKTISFASALHVRFGGRDISPVIIIPYYTVDFDQRLTKTSEVGMKRKDPFPRSFMFGNPYIGIQFSQSENTSFAELGV